MTRRQQVAIAAAGAVALVAAGAVAEQATALFALRFSVQRNAELMPSSQLVPAQELRRGVPTLSLYVSEHDLYDPSTGILANKLEHGRAWERPGSVSYFERGLVRFASTTGVRVHGGGSRITSPRQGYRLYLRRDYGASTIPPRLLFDLPHAHPLRVLIVHNDIRRREGGVTWALVNPLAFDIADAVGGITTPSRPVRFLLNGEFQGVFVLYEHFTPGHYFETHGYGDIRLEADEFGELYRNVRALPAITTGTVGEIVDLENLTRWFMATAFCATRDAFQGPGQFRDATRARAQWFWVNWDMDGSFGNLSADPFFDLLLPRDDARRGRRRDEVRPYLLTRLLADDPAYRERFKRAWIDAMNFQLTPAFLRERFDHYRQVALIYGVRSVAYLPKLQAFLEGRHAVLRTAAERYLQTPAVSWRLDSRRPVVIDGFEVRGPAEGYYFQGMRVTLDVQDADAGRLSFWRINGQPYRPGQARVTLIAHQELTIEAVWK